MVIQIDFASEEALYMQLCNQIIHHIAMEELRPGDSLPSVRELAEDVGINMHTVNKAYALLRSEGYLRLDRRHGAVVDILNDKYRAMESLKNEIRMSLAKALCKGMTDEEIHEAVDEVLADFEEERE